MLSASEIVTIVVIVLVAVILGLGLWALWASNDNSKYNNQQYCGTGYDENIVNQQTITNGQTFNSLTRKFTELEDIEKIVEFFNEKLKQDLVLVNLLFMYMFLMPHVVFNFTKFTGQALGTMVALQSTPPDNLYPRGSHVVPAPNNFLYALESPPPTANSPVVRPNYNTFYNELFADLSQAPVLINLPSFGKRQKNGPTSEMSNINRFWLLQAMSSWSDAFETKGTQYYNNVGKTDLLDKPMQYVITGPSWRLTHLDQCIAQGGPVADLLSNPETHFQCPTDYSYVLLRVLTKSGSNSDKEIVNNLQKQCKAYTLGDSTTIERIQENYLGSPWLQTVLADFNQYEYIPAPTAAAPVNCWKPTKAPTAPTPAPVDQCPPASDNTAPSNCGPACKIELRRLCELHPNSVPDCENINKSTSNTKESFNKNVASKLKPNNKRLKLANIFKRKPKTLEGYLEPNNDSPSSYQTFYQRLHSTTYELDYVTNEDDVLAGVYGDPNSWVAAAPSQLIFNITMNSIWGTGQFEGLGYNYPDPNGLLYDKLALYVWSNFGFNPYNDTLLNAFGTDQMTKEQQKLTTPGYNDAVRSAYPGFQELLSVVWESNYYQDGWVYMAPWIAGGYQGVYKNFIHRQLIVNNGFGANWTYYATYPTVISDNRAIECANNGSGVVTMGSDNTSAGVEYFADYTNLIPCNVYTWTLTADILENLASNEGFWSLSMYSAEGTQTENEWGIYDVSSYSIAEYNYEKNGDLVFYLAYNAQKYIDQGKNVLPLPPPNFDGNYLTPSFRLYYPKNEGVGNLVRAGAKPVSGGDILLPVIQFVENDPTLGTTCKGLNIQWGNNNIDEICPPPKPAPDYICCDCPPPPPAAAAPSSEPTEYLMEIDTFKLLSDNQTIYGQTPVVPPGPTMSSPTQIVENFIVDTPYNMSIKFPEQFSSTGTYELTSSLLNQAGPVWNPEILSNKFGSPGFISAPYLTPTDPFVFTFSTTTPWNEPWLVPIYVANILQPVTTKNVVGDFNGKQMTPTGTLTLNNSKTPLMFQIYMVPIDLSSGTYTLNLNNLQTSVVVMTGGIITTSETPAPPIGPLSPVAAPQPNTAPVAAPQPNISAPVAAPQPNISAPVAAPQPNISAPVAAAPTNCGPACQEIKKLCQKHPRIPGCPESDILTDDQEQIQSILTECDMECKSDLARLCRNYPDTELCKNMQMSQENFELENVGCQIHGCDNSIYCTNGEVQYGIAYYMGPNAKCSSSANRCEDNIRIVQSKNTDCSKLVNIANNKNSHGVEYMHYCPKTLGLC